MGFLAAGEYDETVAKAQVLTARRPPFELLETMRRDPGEPILRLERHIERLRGSAVYFGFAFDEGAVRAALDTVGADADRSVKIRLRSHRADAIEVSSAAWTAGLPSPSVSRWTTFPWIRPTSSCSTRRRCAAATRTRARDIPTRTTRS